MGNNWASRKEEREMNYAQVTMPERSLGKKAPQSSLLPLFVSLLPQHAQTQAHVDVISGHMKEKVVTGNH